MSKKGLKLYTKQCKAYDTIFEGFKVSVGAFYGRILVPYTDGTSRSSDYVFWVCDNPKSIKTGILSIHIMKREWGNNATVRDIRKTVWHDVKVGKNHPIYQAVLTECHKLGGIPVIKTFKNPQIYVDRAYTAIAHEYSYRKHPQPQSRCYKQAQVDGKNWDISWEERVQPMKDADGYNYNGCPVQYNPNDTKQAPFTSFEGFTDTYEAHRRDGMKVNQTKCRPEKQRNNNAVISIKINGANINVK